MTTDLPKITFRKAAVGGAVASAKLCPPNALCNRRRLVLLIHGFNVTEQHASDTYQRFEEQLADLRAITRGSSTAEDRIVEIYWPGDADWDFAKPLAYMRSIPRAKDVGSQLAQLLISAAGTWGAFEVDVVAHSLGCRLGLEFLRAVHDAGDPGVSLRRILFMAGAVPTFMLGADPAARFKAAYEQSLRDGGRSLWSGDDDVLRYAFPPGQTLAGAAEEGFFPTALGHAAWPLHGELARLDRQLMAGAGHGSYWGGDKPELSRETASIAQEYLQSAEAAIRYLPTRTIADRASADSVAMPVRGIELRRTGRVC